MASNILQLVIELCLNIALSTSFLSLANSSVIRITWFTVSPRFRLHILRLVFLPLVTNLCEMEVWHYRQKIETENEIKYPETAESGVKSRLKHGRSRLPGWWNHRQPHDPIFHDKLCLEAVGSADCNFIIVETFYVHLYFKADPFIISWAAF